MGLIDNGNISRSQEENWSSGGSVGGGSSSESSSSWGGTLGTGATSSAFSHQMMQEANEYNAYQAELNRKWQEHMSNTAYQRAIKDLKKAGLNPILAYSNGGASVGSGATASSAMGTAYTDNYTESKSSGHSSEYNRSWNDSYGHSRSQSKSDLANQLSAVAGLTVDAIASLVGDIKGNSGQSFKESVKNFFTGKENPKVTTSNGSWRSK